MREPSFKTGSRRLDRCGRHEFEGPTQTSSTTFCDTASAALSHMSDRGLLSLGEEFRRDERRKLVFRGRERRASIGELYERP
jgi:hypothetical protein